MSNQETRVFNKELAEVMAYAEADYRDAAKRVMQIPDSEEHRDYFLSAAEQNANKAASEYLGTFATILGLQAIEADTVPASNPEIVTNSPTIQVTQADMLVFAAHEENVKKQQGDMKRIWTILNRKRMYLSDVYPGQVTIQDSSSYISSLIKLQLSQQMVDESVYFMGMGPKLHSLLQSYFDSRLSEQAETEL